MVYEHLRSVRLGLSLAPWPRRVDGQLLQPSEERASPSPETLDSELTEAYSIFYMRIWRADRGEADP